MEFAIFCLLKTSMSLEKKYGFFKLNIQLLNWQAINLLHTKWKVSFNSNGGDGHTNPKGGLHFQDSALLFFPLLRTKTCHNRRLYTHFSMTPMQASNIPKLLLHSCEHQPRQHTQSDSWLMLI